MSTAPIPNFALASFKSEGSYTYDALLSDGHHIVSRMGTVASGIGKLYRGQIVKVVVATGVTTVPATAAECNAVLAENVDATAATVPALLYMSGKMKADAVIWPGALAHADVADALRNYGILLESVLFRDGLMVKSAPTAQQTEAAQQRIEENQEEIEGRSGETPEPEEITIAESSWGHLTAEQRMSADAMDLIHPPVVIDEDEEGEETDPPPPTGLDAVVTITPTSASVLATGGSGSVVVTITTPGDWSVYNPAAWVTVTPTGVQTVSGTVQWTASAITPGAAARTASISIGNQTFTLDQDALTSRRQ